MKPVIIGAGLAGLTVALSLAPMPVILLTSKKLDGESSSAWAQGGIAAAMGVDDNAGLHASDTVKAGAGLCDAAVVQQVTADGAVVIEKLVRCGALFDRDSANQLQLGLEAAHSRRRIVHAGDATGAAVMQALIKAVRNTPSIEVLEDVTALDIAANASVCGVTVNRNGETDFIKTDKIILATGGAGALWKHTTNPLSSWGQGLALAAKAGALLGDLEFMQFHPTAIDIGFDPMPLASEALRGEGAILVDERGNQFTDSLQPRDIVTRAIWKHSAAGHKIFLDARTFAEAKWTQHFPHIQALCLKAGIDPMKSLIPVRPAAHYHMGGVVTDAYGRTNVKGLWACGEVANTGLHGANRLASNSLLEAASFGARVAADVAGSQDKSAGVPPPSLTLPARGRENFHPCHQEIRALMSQHVGVLRDQKALSMAVEQLAVLAPQSDMALAGLMIATAALKRKESRGAHTRTDFPVMVEPAKRSTLSLAEIMPLLENNQRRVAGA